MFREARELAGLPLRALARHLDIDVSHLSRWERGERQLSDDKRRRAEAALEAFTAGGWSP